MSKKKNIDDVLAAMRPPSDPPAHTPQELASIERLTLIIPKEPAEPEAPPPMTEIEELHKRLEVEPDEIEREKIVERLEVVEMSAMADAAKESETRRVYTDDGPRPPALEPTIGRIVHYRAGTGRTYAAMIVFVYPDSHHVNLTIFSYEGHVSAIERVSFGHELGNWRWPPRV